MLLDPNNITKSNVLMSNVDVTGNATIGGSGINFGNEAGDTVDFAMEFEQDLLPTNNTQQNIGPKQRIGKTTNPNKNNIR